MHTHIFYTRVCVMERPGPVWRPSGNVRDEADGGEVVAQSVSRISLRTVRACLTISPLSPLSDLRVCIHVIIYSLVPPSSHTSRRLNPSRGFVGRTQCDANTISTSSFVFFTDIRLYIYTRVCVCIYTNLSCMCI